MSTTEGWNAVMWSGVDTTQVDYVPKKDNNIYYVFFFIAFIVIGSQFFINLFVGVVINTFNKQKGKLEKNFLLTEEQKQWIQVQLVAFKAKPIRKAKPSSSRFRNLCIYIADHEKFETFILVCIILNTIVLATTWYGEPEKLSEGLNYFNNVLALIFTIEAIIKIVALKTMYFYDGWNIFDFIIVVGTIIFFAI